MANPSADSAAIQGVGAFGRDDNAVPITQLGLKTTSLKTLSANGTTVNIPIFTVTGSVIINALYGVVTTVLGNNTAAYWRLNDGTTQTNITLNTGTTLTAAAVNSLIMKITTSASALTLLNASAGKFQETSANHAEFQNFVVVQKTGGVATNIEFTYTTADTPTSGAIIFYATWIPLVAGSSVTAL